MTWSCCFFGLVFFAVLLCCERLRVCHLCFRGGEFGERARGGARERERRKEKGGRRRRRSNSEEKTHRATFETEKKRRVRSLSLSLSLSLQASFSLHRCCCWSLSSEQLPLRSTPASTTEKKQKNKRKLIRSFDRWPSRRRRQRHRIKKTLLFLSPLTVFASSLAAAMSASSLAAAALASTLPTGAAAEAEASAATGAEEDIEVFFLFSFLELALAAVSLWLDPSLLISRLFAGGTISCWRWW